ncbi:type III secretion system chaperone [Salmonella enterica]|nr:hypothetical protein [Salmonella enterica]EAZ5906740.1 type III secretion system chaperone [Salmonella enterica]EFV4530961.1 type III secretion system chaperone [Salmonella enterica]EFW6052985.1 type III secretion system chaperone [Salmonella enterica]EHE9227767.1 type III secretion system chaperone [Salmonella enterica]
MSRLSILFDYLLRHYNIFEAMREESRKSYTIEINDIFFYFFYDECKQVVYIQADVGEFISGLTSQTLRSLLNMNYMWSATNGGGIGFYRENNMLTYNCRVSSPLIKSQDYDEYFVDLIDEITHCVYYAKEILYSV